MKKEEWFTSWFDTEYYHILYQNRGEEEAKIFIKHLINHLKIPKESDVLDLACGKGRYSITLNELGYSVIGADLSPNSIQEAKQFEKSGLNFLVHDMREVILNHSFSAVFNLFTSFGYFDSTSDNEKVLSAIHQMLLPNGILVIDFMNATKVIKELVFEEQISLENIDFNIRRNFDGTHIFKHIDFHVCGENHSYMERVQGLRLSEFQGLFSKTGFELISTFGDFELAPFNEENSDRLIMIAQKK